MKIFTIEDLRNAYEAGQGQKLAEWENDRTSNAGFYNFEAEGNFDSWFNENFKNK